MKGVEARACGVARYFPFVLPYYDENNNNFGMTDRRGSPMLSLAAYAQMIRVLGQDSYLGDLKDLPKALPRPGSSATAARRSPCSTPEKSTQRPRSASTSP